MTPDYLALPLKDIIKRIERYERRAQRMRHELEFAYEIIDTLKGDVKKLCRELNALNKVKKHVD